MWGSILLATRPDDKSLRAAVSRVLGVASKDVLIIVPTTPDTLTASVVVDVTPVMGDFAVLVEVYTGAELESGGTLEAMKSLCVDLGTSAFVDDDSYNPASGFLVSETGRVTAAMIDHDAEDLGAYQLVRKG